MGSRPENAELTAALSQRDAREPQSSARSGGCLVTGKHLNTHARQLFTRFSKTSIPSVEPLFKVVGTNRGMADHLDQKLHAGWKHFKGEVSGMGTVRRGSSPGGVATALLDGF